MNFWEKPIVGIYKITHRDTGKAYIGQSVDIFKRWKSHSNFAQAKKNWQVIKHALNKHGVAQFTFEVLEECSKEDLNDREIYWIKHFDTVSPAGYNLTSGGGGVQNPSEEIRKKIGKANKGKIRTEETKAKLSKVRLDNMTDKRRKQCSESRSVPIIINNIEYPSLKVASENLNVHISTIYRWLNGYRRWPKGLSGYYK